MSTTPLLQPPACRPPARPRSHRPARTGGWGARRASWTAVLLALPLLVTHAAPRSLPAAESPPADRDACDQRFRTELEALAEKCVELGLPEQAAATRAWIIERDDERQYLFLPPENDPLEPPRDAERLERAWYDKFRKLRDAQAERLFDLARRRLAEGEGAAAYQLLHEVLRENPDHQAARRILGHRRQATGWSHANRETRAAAGQRNHLPLGWRRGRYWIVESEHYRILTSHSPEAGVELAAELERLHAVWRQAFFDFWGSGEVLERRFEGRDVPLAPRRSFQVVLFRDRAEYLDRLGRVEPQIQQMVGYYLARNRTAYFYAGDESTRSTWFHEASHQLFQESVDAVTDPGAERDFWIVEGAALYMESLRPHGDHCRLGGWDANRLQFARYRALYERFQVPLAEFLAYGRQRLQQDDEIRRLYSQAAGLTHFFMDSGGGIYREALVEYLRDVYRGRADARRLLARWQRSADELDAEYRRFLNVNDRQLRFLDHPAGVRNLCLAHTEVTDEGLRVLQECRELQWLDLAFTRVSDATVNRLDGARQLRQLSLERTSVGDAALATIARLKSLEELDLSHTGVTDEGVTRLSGLSGLTVLWLTGTRISDAALGPLAKLRALETLDVSRTGVTPGGWSELREELPQLRN